MDYRMAGLTNALLGGWLLASAFLWTHSRVQFNNAIMVGGMVALFAVLALLLPLARYVNTVLAGWLLVSAFELPAVQTATIYNSALLAVAIFVLSLVGAPDDLPKTDRSRL